MSSFRILALIPDAFGSLGGISKFNRDLLTALCLHPGCKEVVAIPRLMPSPPGPLPNGLTWVTNGLGGKLRYLSTLIKTALGHSHSAPGKLSTLNLQPSTAFDLIICGHINLLPAAFLARRLCRLRQPGLSTLNPPPPIALFIHGIDAWQPHRSRLVRRLARRVDAVIAVSQFTLKRFLDWSGLPAERGSVLPNCVDLAGFSPGKKDPELLKRYGLEDRKVLMTLGRLLPDRPKGIEEVLAVLTELANDIPQASYLIVGDGPDRPRLAAKARSLGLRVLDCTEKTGTSSVHHQLSTTNYQPTVVFAGRITEPEKAAHYRLADAFVMPGYGEGFGIVYLEALACGIPVLGSTLDASREALRDGALGAVVNPRNRTALRNAILGTLREPSGTVKNGLAYFSFPNFLQRCHSIVDTLCPAPAQQRTNRLRLSTEDRPQFSKPN